jgi:hypothetical protein
MAGEQLRCECGNELEVPTLRGLGQLPRDDHGAHAPRERSWTDRQRLSFVLVVLGLAAGSLAGYLTIRLPPAPHIVAAEIDEAALQASSPDDIHAAFEELKKGIKPRTEVYTAEARQALDQRIKMHWAVRLLLALGAVSLAAALILAVLRPGAAPAGHGAIHRS